MAKEALLVKNKNFEKGLVCAQGQLIAWSSNNTVHLVSLDKRRRVKARITCQVAIVAMSFASDKTSTVPCEYVLGLTDVEGLFSLYYVVFDDQTMR